MATNFWAQVSDGVSQFWARVSEEAPSVVSYMKSATQTKAAFSVQLTKDFDSVQVNLYSDAARTNLVASSGQKDLAESQNLRMGRFLVTGLSPGTTYYGRVSAWGVEDETTDLQITTLDPAGTAKNLKILFSNCNFTGSTDTVWDRMAARNGDLFIHTGDIHYEDGTTTDPLFYLGGYDQNFASPQMTGFLEGIPMVYTTDDHGYPTNNSDSTSPGMAAAQEALRTGIPHIDVEVNPEGDTGAYYWSRVIGRFRIISPDLRAEREATAGQIMSSAQMTWIKDEITAAKNNEQAVILISSVPWITEQNNDPNDDWSAYPSERLEIADHVISEGMEDQGIILSGDMHGMAADDGTNNTYGTSGSMGWPVMHGGALNQNPSLKGGPYSQGTFTARDGNHAVLDITDNGSGTITVDMSGYDDTNTEQVSLTTTVTISIKAEGAVTDGGETVSGSAETAPDADGAVTEGGETVSATARAIPLVSASITDTGETVTATAETVPVVETANIVDTNEDVSGDAYTTVQVTGAITEGGETVAGVAEPLVSVEGAVTEGSEVIEGEGNAQLLSTAAVTESGEIVQGVVTNSVGADKVLVRSDLDGTVVAFRKNTLNVTTRMNACDNANFRVFLRPGEERPLDVGEPVSVYLDERQDKRVWAGTVDRYEEDDYVGAENYTREVSYECVCYSALADRYHVAASYRDEVAGDIVRDFLDQYLAQEGVTAGTIEDGPTVDKANFSYTPVSKALNDLSDETGFSWFIDDAKALHFRSRSSTLGDLTIDDSYKPFRTFTIERGRREYRNRQVVRGGKGRTEERTETFVGDGTRRTFTTTFDLAETPTITVNGTPQSVGIAGLDDGDDFYWNKGSNTISQDEAATPLTTGDTLSVTYIGLIPIAVEASEQDQINQRAAIEGGAGIYENVVTDASIDTQDGALERAEGLLRRFARIDERVSFELDVLSVRQGQLIEIDLPTRDVQGEYLIDSANFRVKDNDEMRATVTALSGEAYGGWTKFFRELKAAKQEFTVRENENVLLQRRVSDEENVTDTASTLEDTVEAFIIGADGSTPGGGDSRIGYNRIGNAGHEENTPNETVDATDSYATSTDSILTFSIGTDEIGFEVVG